MKNYNTLNINLFLLTHPVWDVTNGVWNGIQRMRFLLTHPVWDVTDLREDFIVGSLEFLLTHPVWDVT